MKKLMLMNWLHNMDLETWVKWGVWKTTISSKSWKQKEVLHHWKHAMKSSSTKDKSKEKDTKELCLSLILCGQHNGILKKGNSLSIPFLYGKRESWVKELPLRLSMMDWKQVCHFHSFKKKKKFDSIFFWFWLTHKKKIIMLDHYINLPSLNKIKSLIYIFFFFLTFYMFFFECEDYCIFQYQ